MPSVGLPKVIISLKYWNILLWENLSLINLFYTSGLFRKGTLQVARNGLKLLCNLFYALSHCVKNVQIRSFFWAEYGKIRTRENSVFGQFSQSVSWNDWLPRNFFFVSAPWKSLRLLQLIIHYTLFHSRLV